MQNKGLLHYNFWLGNSFSNKIWKSIEKNLHHSIKGRDIKTENVGSPLSFSLEAKFQLEEIALEQLNGSVRASPHQQQGGISFLAGVLVFVHVGLYQVGHLTGVHLTTLAVTHLRKKNTARVKQTASWNLYLNFSQIDRSLDPSPNRNCPFVALQP